MAAKGIFWGKTFHVGFNVSIRFRGVEYESATCQAEEVIISHKSQIQISRPLSRIYLSCVKH